MFHEWVLPLVPTPPDANGANFSKTNFAQSIFLQAVLNDQVEKAGNLVVVTQVWNHVFRQEYVSVIKNCIDMVLTHSFTD